MTITAVIPESLLISYDRMLTMTQDFTKNWRCKVITFMESRGVLLLRVGKELFEKDGSSKIRRKQIMTSTLD